MLEGAKLSGLAEAEIEALEADGYRLTAAEIVRLNALAWNVETPESRRLLSRGLPVFVGGATLWPLTLAAEDWLDRVGRKLRPKWLRTSALAYAMAHGRDDGGLDLDGITAAIKIGLWQRRLRCTWGELNVAMSQIIGQDSGLDLPPDTGAGKPLKLGEFSAELAAAAGGTPDFWETRCSRSYCFSVLSAIARQNAADGKPLADDRIRAERALGWAVELIRRRGVSNGQT